MPSIVLRIIPVSIRDWPIFIDFRKTKEYERFLQEHTEDFKVQELEVENQNRDIGALTQMAPNLVMSSIDAPIDSGCVGKDLRGQWVVEKTNKKRGDSQ